MQNRQSLSSYLRGFLLRRNDKIGVTLRFKGLILKARDLAKK